MLQHNKLDVVSFVSVKLKKQTKNYINISEGSNKNVETVIWGRGGN